MEGIFLAVAFAVFGLLTEVGRPGMAMAWLGAVSVFAALMAFSTTK